MLPFDQQHLRARPPAMSVSERVSVSSCTSKGSIETPPFRPLPSPPGLDAARFTVRVILPRQKGHITLTYGKETVEQFKEKLLNAINRRNISLPVLSTYELVDSRRNLRYSDQNMTLLDFFRDPAHAGSKKASITENQLLLVEVVGNQSSLADETSQGQNHSLEARLATVMTKNRQLMQQMEKYSELVESLKNSEEKNIELQTQIASCRANNGKKQTNGTGLPQDCPPTLSPAEMEQGVSQVRKKVLSFVQDSPFFRRDIAQVEEQMRQLGKLLKAVTDQGHNFLKQSNLFGDALKQFADTFDRYWGDTEADSTAALSLGYGMKLLGSALKDLEKYREIFSYSIDKMTIDPIRQFREIYIQGAKESAKTNCRACDEYEACLCRFLGTKRPKTAKQNDALSSQHENVLKLYTKQEISRFDHVDFLNTIQTDSMLNLLETICACQCIFQSYFHQGHHLLKTLQPTIQGLRVRIEHARTVSASIKEKTRISRVKYLAQLPTASTNQQPAAHPGSPPLSPHLAAAPLSTPRHRANTTTTKKQPEIEETKQGYLLKQSTSVRKDWKRRWFRIHDGQLFYHRSAKQLGSEFVVNLLLCNVREATSQELPYCFEIISPNRRVYLLQAESKEDMQDWIDVIRMCTEQILQKQNSAETQHGRKMSDASAQKLEKSKYTAILTLRELNKECVDCRAPDPDWVSINLGVMMCIECSGIHRSLGTHLSKVRSLSLDTWTEELLQLLVCIGNPAFNNIWEYTAEDDQRPTADATREIKEQWIRWKYVDKSFLNYNCLGGDSTSDDLGQILCEAIISKDIPTMMKVMALGVDVNWTNVADGSQSALHNAAEGDDVVALEYLIQNGANLNLKDHSGRTALDCARSCGSKAAMQLLSSKLHLS